MKFLLCIFSTIYGKCFARHLKRIPWRDKVGDLFIFKRLSFVKGSRVIKEGASVGRS